MADPDKQEYERQQAAEQRRRMAEIEQMKHGIAPFTQAARAGQFAIGPNAGQALLDAIHEAQDRLDASKNQMERIQQAPKLGTSPDAVVMSRYTRQIGVDGATVILGLQQILVDWEAGIVEAMKHYRRMDEDGAAGITGAGQ